MPKLIDCGKRYDRLDIYEKIGRLRYRSRNFHLKMEGLRQVVKYLLNHLQVKVIIDGYTWTMKGKEVMIFNEYQEDIYISDEVFQVDYIRPDNIGFIEQEGIGKYYFSNDELSRIKRRFEYGVEEITMCVRGRGNMILRPDNCKIVISVGLEEKKQYKCCYHGQTEGGAEVVAYMEDTNTTASESVVKLTGKIPSWELHEISKHISDTKC